MDMKAATTRIVDGREVPPAGTWKIDPSHSEIQFYVRHMMISKVRGRFREFEGTIEIGERPQDSRVDVVIEAASIDTRDRARDEHLRSAEFLDVERFPELRFTSTSARPGEKDRWDVTGDLKVRDVTRPVVLHVEFNGATVDPWGNLRAGFLADAEIDREDFDITWNQALEAGGFLVGKGVRVEIDVEAVRRADP
ncbi:MAG: YceI family protein [Ilumatobacteraceae bacterium]